MKYIGICISALACNSAFAYPTLFFWQIFLFLIPIFYYGVYAGSLTFLDGFFWGFIYNTIHFLEFFFLLKKYNSLIVAAGCFFCLVVYSSVYAGGWFCIGTFVSSRHHAQWYKRFIWIMVSWFYFFFIQFYLFWMIGMGDCFANLLLPCAHYPSTLRLLPIVGSTVLVLSVIICAQLLTAALVTKKISFLWGALCFVIPFCVGLMYQYPAASVPQWLHTIGYVAPLANYTGYPLDDAQEINHKIMQFLYEHPHKKIVIMPEEGYPYPLNTVPEAVVIWQQNGLASGVTLLIGAHKVDREKLFNSLYRIDDTNISALYDKSFLVPLYEYIPSPSLNWARKLFLKDKQGFCASDRQQTPIAITDGCVVMPYICSDLYFSTQYKLPNTLLCIVNDGWCYLPEMRHIMYLFARYRAIELRQPCIYIGHHRGLIIASDGSLLDCAL